MTTRHFTSAALRPHEEMPAEAVAWLPRSIAVDYDGDRPVSGVWRTVDGWQRVCWYASAVSPVVEAHAARYGAVPFWVIDRSAMRERVVVVHECDVAGRVWATRTLGFDKQHMPEREEHRAAGAPTVVRRFRCVADGRVVHATEQVAGYPLVQIAPPRFPAPELAGDPYPCGATIGHDGPRLVSTIQRSMHGGRHVAIHRDGATWRRGLATWVTCDHWRYPLAPVLDFKDPQVARRLHDGELIDRRNPGPACIGLVEERPEGRALDEVVRDDGVLDVETALGLALAAAAVARRAHAKGHLFGGLHAELIFVRGQGAQRALTAIAHRGPAVIAQYMESEPGPLSIPDAATMMRVDDATCLAQLVWFLVTGTQPFGIPPTVAWPTWHGARYQHRRRHAWTGGAALGALLERALFADRPMAFDALVEGLEARRGEATPYR